MALNAKTITNKEYFYGHKACGGCGAALAIRLALKVLGDRAIAVIPPNCMSTVAFIYPHMPLFTNGMIPPFAGTAAVMSGIALGYSTCFYADAVFMTTAGTSVSNITVIRTTIPYAAGAAVIAVVGFLLCGAGVF